MQPRPESILHYRKKLNMFDLSLGDKTTITASFLPCAHY